MMNRYLSKVAEVGDLVECHPFSRFCILYSKTTGYSRDQVFNPNRTTMWRVFKSCNGETELISDRSVGSLYLNGEFGFRNAPNGMRVLADEFLNTRFVTKARCLGYKEECRCKIMTPMTSSYVRKNCREPYTDNYYEEDVKYIAENSLISPNDTLWMPSRDIHIKEDNWVYFGIRSVRGDGLVRFNPMCGVNGFIKHSTMPIKNSVYVIITLGEDVKIQSGDGRSGRPYILTR